MSIPYLTTKAACGYLKLGDGDSLRIAEDSVRSAIKEVKTGDEKIALVDEMTREFGKMGRDLPVKDGRIRVLLDYVDRQRRLLRGELS